MKEKELEIPEKFDSTEQILEYLKAAKEKGWSIDCWIISSHPTKRDDGVGCPHCGTTSIDHKKVHSKSFRDLESMLGYSIEEIPGMYVRAARGFPIGASEYCGRCESKIIPIEIVFVRQNPVAVKVTTIRKGPRYVPNIPTSIQKILFDGKKRGISHPYRHVRSNGGSSTQKLTTSCKLYMSLDGRHYIVSKCQSCGHTALIKISKKYMKRIVEIVEERNKEKEKLDEEEKKKKSKQAEKDMVFL